MADLHLRKYGVATTIDFELYSTNGVDLQSGATFAAGDVKIMKDEGAEANIGTLPTDEGQGYSLPLTAAEASAARIVIYIVDQTSPKAWMDKVIIIETVNHSSAQIDGFWSDVKQWASALVATPNVAGYPRVDVSYLGGDSQSGADLKDFADSGYDPATNKVEGVKIADALTTNNDKTGYGLADGAITAAKIATAAITAAKFGAGAINAAALAADAVDEIVADILATPANKLATNASGQVVASSLVGHTPQTGDSYVEVTNLTYGLSAIENLVDDLESRLTAARAGYLDNLNGHTPQTGDSYAEVTSVTYGLSVIENLVDELESRLTAARAGYLDNLIYVPEGIKKNTAFTGFTFVMTDISDHITPLTGLTVTGQRSLDGAALQSVSGTITEISNGLYRFDPATADTNCDNGAWRFSAAGADDKFVTFRTSS